ncbi:MAG: wax ester/triacylglycerol synthase domain-containing protein [Solirubrobacteraceae bacterium]
MGRAPSAQQLVAAGEVGEQARRAAMADVLADALTREQAAERLGITAQAVSDQRKNGRLVVLRRDREWRLPRWQFGDDGALPGLPAVIAAWPGTSLALTVWAIKASPDLAGRALTHIGAAFVFGPLPGGGTPAIGQLRAHLEQRLELLPRYRQKLDAPRTGGLTWPSWERDQRFEIEAHVRHATLPSPGKERELLSWVSDFYSHRLDRNRPLWEMVLLDGLANGRGLW